MGEGRTKETSDAFFKTMAEEQRVVENSGSKNIHSTSGKIVREEVGP